MRFRRVNGLPQLTLEYGDEVALVEPCDNYPITPLVEVGAWVPVGEDGTVMPDTAGRTPEEQELLWWGARDAASGTVTALAPYAQVSFAGGVAVFTMIPGPPAPQPEPTPVPEPL